MVTIVFTKAGFRIFAGPIKRKDGRPIGSVLGISEVTEKRHALRELSYRSTHDIVTRLPNRSLFTDRLQQGSAGPTGTGPPWQSSTWTLTTSKSQ
ncbi:MAG: hypothetical protein ACWGN1_04440 [Desulfobulbales bacterium]